MTQVSTSTPKMFELRYLQTHSSVSFICLLYSTFIHRLITGSDLMPVINKVCFSETDLKEQSKILLSIYYHLEALMITAEYMFLYIGRYKTLHISCQYKPQA